MVYHFVKRIDIDIEAESLEAAAEVIEDMENDYIGDEIEDFLDDIAYDTDHADNIISFDANSCYTEYAGDPEEDDPEKRFYDHISDEGEDDHYVLTDKGKDLLDYINGNRADFDESNYDEKGNRIKRVVDPKAYLESLISAYVDAVFHNIR